jgi:(p)ppGpp synthase/HD superfamily hydrolase
MEEFSQFLTLLDRFPQDADRVLITKAAEFAARCHAGFKRLDGSPYILHPLAVAAILNERYAPANILAAALLHDIFKAHYSHVPSQSDLEETFPPALIKLIGNVASLGKWGVLPTLKQSEGDDEQASIRNSQQFLLAMELLQPNPMAVVIKLADRLHNLRVYDSLPDLVRREQEKWFAIATLNIFAPLADRLGMQNMKEQLEDGAFRLYNHERYARLDESRKKIESNEAVTTVIQDLERKLHKRNIQASVSKKLKHHYGIFREQLASATREVTLTNILHIVIIVTTVEECYRTLALVQSIWHPVSPVYDNIAEPKQNGYRALHLRTFEPSLGAIGIIIRTQAMHLAADYGITSQWQGVVSDLLPKIEPLPERPDGHIMAISPKGEVKYLLRGATAIDFAYAIHEEMGHRCMQAWVNGKHIPLVEPLEDGAVVDIIVSRGIGGPNREWLQYVVTPVAREAIERWIRRETYLDLTIEGTDRIGLLKDVIECISMKGINIHYVYSNVLTNKVSIHLILHVIGPNVFDDLEKELNGVAQVTHVKLNKTSTFPQTLLIETMPDSTSTLPKGRVTSSPYDLMPVVGHNFKGREREVQEIADRLRGRERNNTLLVWGQQRIGKTSLLLHLEQYILPSQKYLIVYCSLHECLHQPIYNFLHAIARKIVEKVQKEVKAPHIEDMRREPVFSFQRFIGQLEEVIGPQSLLIILDEFQGIGTLKEEGATRQDVFTYFRSLLQQGVTVSFLFCGGGIPGHLLMQSGLSSLLSIVDPIKVGVLEKEAARSLIVVPDVSMHYEEQAIQKLLEITNCHPCYLKFLCQELYVARIERNITLMDVEKAIERIMEWEVKLLGLVQHFWEMDLQNWELAKKNRAILATIAQYADSSRWISFDKLASKMRSRLADEELSELLTHLTGYGSLDVSNSNYHIHLPLLDLWFQKI